MSCSPQARLRNGAPHFEVGDLAQVRGSWHQVAKVNPKSLAVRSGMRWPLKYPYHEVRDHRRTTAEQRVRMNETAAPE